VRTLVGVLCLTMMAGAAAAGGEHSIAAAAISDIHGIASVGMKPEANVAVWVDAPGAPRQQAARPVLEQRNMDFYPRVLVVEVGTVVDFPNHDRVLHNVFSFHNGKKFDLGIYPTGSVKRVTFDKPGLSRLLCNIHPHMMAYVMAVESPYFALSDQSGRFVIRDVPTGTRTYHWWKPGVDAPMTASAAMNGDTMLEARWQ
jgi:plastocyanin